MTDLTKLTLVESIKHVKEKKCSAAELVSAYVKRIEKSDKLNCFNTKDLENAVSKAKKIDANKKLDKVLVGAPIASVSDQPLTMNKDEIKKINEKEEILKNAPEKNSNYYIVPKVIE